MKYLKYCHVLPVSMVLLDFLFGVHFAMFFKWVLSSPDCKLQQDRNLAPPPSYLVQKLEPVVYFTQTIHVEWKNKGRQE